MAAQGSDILWVKGGHFGISRFILLPPPQINCPARWSHHSLLWAIWSDVINPGAQQPQKVEPYVLSKDKQQTGPCATGLWVWGLFWGVFLLLK